MLKGIKEDEQISFMTDKKKKICEITKKYTDTGFPDDELSIGYAIDVFQETINKSFREYLVNFTFFQRILENYGFSLVTRDEAKQMGLPDATGMFSELYEQMQTEIKQDSRKKANYKDALFMSDGEKSLSFMNRYFIFKKTTSVNAAQIEQAALKQIKMVNMGEEELVDFGDLGEQVEEERKKKAVTGKIRKLKVKIRLTKGKAPLEINEEVEEDDVLEMPSGLEKEEENIQLILDEEGEGEEKQGKEKESNKDKLEELVIEEKKEQEKKEEEQIKESKTEKITIRVKKPKKL